MVLPRNSLNRQGPALLTDLYELTMAYAYWKSGMVDTEAVFNVSFRKNPFQGGFAVFTGLSGIMDFLSGLRFEKDDIEYLAGVTDSHGAPVFESGFLQYLSTLRFDIDLHACLDGSVVFAHEPIVRVSGPIIPAQIIESALLNLIGYSTLVATRAARIKLVAGKQPVFEFGLRRAQGMDGALTGSLAAYLGGCDGTSNTLAGKIFGIPVRGTQAHSWIMAHCDELESFIEYANAMPSNCIFLVDTFDTIGGVENAIRAGLKLREQGHEMIGIRLDSGDLAYLSIQARKMLDEAGFPEAMIVASNELDESIICSLQDQGARIDAWAIGTKLMTASDNPSLGVVYKLSAIRQPGKSWRYCLKLSEQVAKISTPGLLQVRRFYSNKKKPARFMADMIFDEHLGGPQENLIVDPMDFTRRKKMPARVEYEDLLRPVFERGELVADYPGFEATRAFVQQQLAGFHPGIKRLMNPHQYPVGLEMRLHERKTELILEARGYRSGDRVEA